MSDYRPGTKWTASTMVGLALLTAGCQTYSGSESAAHPLTGATWQLVSIDAGGKTTSLTLEQQLRHTLSFGADGTLLLQLDCNRGRAEWSAGLPENSIGFLTVNRIASTRALCPQPTFGEDLAAGLPVANNYVLLPGGAGLKISTRHVMFTFARK